MLCFQSIVSTRNDLGTLASLHNRFVRLALIRLRLSMKEYLDALPPDTENLFKQVIRPDPQAKARLFIPTRPSLLSRNEQIRLTIVSTGNGRVLLHTRVRGSSEWINTPAKPVARKTYEAMLGPFQTGATFVEYFVSCGNQTSPTYVVTVI